MGFGGGQSTSTQQTNNPPAWAEPLLQLGAADAMKMYQSGDGYNVYRGPTQAQMSDQTLAGMNGILAATGYTGAPVANQTPQQLFPDVMKMLADQQKDGAKRPSGGGGRRPQGSGGFNPSQWMQSNEGSGGLVPIPMTNAWWSQQGIKNPFPQFLGGKKR